MKRWLWLVVLAALILIVLGAVLYQAKNKPYKQFSDPTTGTQFDYPINASVTSLSEQDKQEKVIFKASQNDPKPYSIKLAYETGLSTLANLSKQDSFSLVYGNAQKTLAQQFPGYKQISTKSFDHNGRKAAEIVFEYDGNGDKVTEHFWLIMKDDDTAIYLAVQAKSSQYEELEKTFEHIFTSISLG